MANRVNRPEQLKELLGIPFTAEQMACITAPPAPAVIVAGAGSGKTTVMAARVVWLVGTGQVAPDQVLGLTFTNKAAAELSERVRRALARAGITPGEADGPPHPGQDPDRMPGDPQISTYHAFAGQLLKDHGMRIGLEPSARLLADATRFQLAAKVLRAAPGPYPALTKGLPTLVGDLLALSGELSEHLVAAERLRAHDGRLAARLAELDPGKRGYAWVKDVAQTTAARRDLAELAAAYRQEKAGRDLLDFGDQIALSAELAQGRPEVGAILRDQYRVVLLDEYQDTSVAQRLLLAGLFGGGSGHAVTAVGDPCQAIYGWRGASVANLDDFPRHFPHADGRPADRYSLSENRRSGGRLLDLANTLAVELRARHEGVEALRPAPGAERDGVVRCALLPTQQEETDWLADSVAHLVRTGTPPGEIAVLCRTATHFAGIHAALVARDVPVEVVGLSGLLHLPEVADLVATCEVLHDPTANAALVRLLTGPRWRIGPRDLALLGRRARQLVRHGPGAGGEDSEDTDRLAAAVEGVDPAEVLSLTDALETFLDAEPGDELPFSAEARVRFARMAAEIRELRRSLADPLMDVLHRVLAVTGLEVELAASPHALAARRQETLHAFLDVAASFAALDGEATLLAFLGFLHTAAEYEKGLDSSLPGGEDTVKVLTAHKAKGLEWDVVVVPGLVAKGFPSERGRELWPLNAKVLPHGLRGDAETLPEVETWTRAGLDGFRDAMKEHQRIEELRLGYVTFTRPRSLLLGSGHWWGPTQSRPFGPSAFLDALRAHCEAGHGEIEVWAEPPAEDADNPSLASATEPPWPLPLDPTALRRRRHAATTVLAQIDAARADASEAPLLPHPTRPPSPRPALPPQSTREQDAPDPAEPGKAEPDGPEGPGPADPRLDPDDSRLVAAWDRDLTALTGELRRARATLHDVPLPRTLTATQLIRLAADPDGLARDLARPLPRPPAPAARRGTRFHAWVESRFDARPLFAPEDLPGIEPGDDIADEQDLAALKDAFLRSPYADRVPYRVEAPFTLTLAGRLIRGRIDAVYREQRPPADPAGTQAADPDAYEIVDWKTGHRPDAADPLQLAIYRLAWAEQQGVPVERVRAAFLHIRSGTLVRPADLPDREALERLLSSDPPARPVR
ncbi:DNA helicase-2 / ATP-dependent DNA helicase PcrA [Actinacidiphila yanglinensis]|uniref:DNA 3'-5' helicase n=1 Tax=Actinacidiphila yanglinensis TaxID=310779 RepID=A0A1H5VA29_9ACTN|nr:ATP-dependent DNA helicase [Actinacidiphila yanglinensis]SEF84189.1 DNA helicase-2 / ATP-dependent DNA helicase PcrA [Actinacidiphila yanglinensis]